MTPSLRILFSSLVVSFLLSCGGGGSSDAGAAGATGGGDAGGSSTPTDDGSAGNDSEPSGDINTAAGGTIGSVTPPLSAMDFANQFSAPSNRPAAPPNTIAYVRSGSSGASLRLVNSDGNDDRAIFSTPPNRFIGDLSWRPDNTEIAF